MDFPLQFPDFNNNKQLRGNIVSFDQECPMQKGLEPDLCLKSLGLWSNEYYPVSKRSLDRAGKETRPALTAFQSPNVDTASSEGMLARAALQSSMNPQSHLLSAALIQIRALHN